MARYEYHLNPDGPGFLIDVQADVLGDLRTTVVVPLDRVARLALRAERLNPVFDIEGEAFVLLPQLIFALPRSSLGRSRGDLSAEQDRIKAALDLLFLGI